MRQTFRAAVVFLGFFLLVTAAYPWRAEGQTLRAEKPVAKSDAMEFEAVNIIRVINTAEVSTCQNQTGEAGSGWGFRPWARLVNAPCLKEAQSRYLGSAFAQIRKLSFSSEPEIVPGFVLRLVVSPDGNHYNVWLGQERDVHCGLAFYSDERGVIYKGRAIGCGAGDVF